MATLTSQQIAEIARCKVDPIYFIEKYCYIEHPKQGIIPFKLYTFQKGIVSKFTRHKYNILNKSRQVGMSTLTANYALWLAMFNKNQKIIVISIKDDDAKGFLDKIKFAFYRLPTWMRGPDPTTDNLHSLTLATTKSTITSVPSGNNAARSKSLNLLIIDECAFIERIDEIWKSALPTLSRGGQAILLSTPNGVGNFFHRTYTSAENGENDFIHSFVHWKEVDEYQDPEWFKTMRRQFTDREWAQEFEGDFLGSGNTVIPGEYLKEVKTWIKEPVRTEHNSMGWIWKEPIKDHFYIIGIDTASGAAEEFSAFAVIDVNEGEMVYEFRGKLPINPFAQIAYDTAIRYNEAYMVVENTGIGLATTNQLFFNLGYWNFFMQENIQTAKRTKKPGFSTTSKSRPLVINAVSRYFTEGVWKMYSSRLYNELQTFVWKDGGKAEHEQGYTDDSIFALGLAALHVEIAARKTPLSAGIKDEINQTFAGDDGAFQEPPDVNMFRGNTMQQDIDEYTWLISERGKDKDVRDVNFQYIVRHEGGFRR